MQCKCWILHKGKGDEDDLTFTSHPPLKKQISTVAISGYAASARGSFPEENVQKANINYLLQE